MDEHAPAAGPPGWSSLNRILVIGGTGNVGRQVVYQLAATEARFRAMTRNPDAAGFPAQIDVVHGDLTIPEPGALPSRDRYGVPGVGGAARGRGGRARAHCDARPTHRVP